MWISNGGFADPRSQALYMGKQNDPDFEKEVITSAEARQSPDSPIGPDRM